MGRKMMTCNIGDVFGCFKVLAPPYIKGEHSFVHIECIYCHKEQDLALSEIKNRPKQRCQYCRGSLKIVYPDPIEGEIRKNWIVLNNKKKEKGFWYYKCKCTKCEHIQYVRKDFLYTSSKKCDSCKYIAKKERTMKKMQMKVIRRNQPFITAFNHVCSEAGKRSIPVTITPEYLKYIYNKQNKLCAITGDYLPDIRKASVDRIDSKKAYEEGNIQIVTKQANISKHVMTMEELYIFCRKVLNHANQQPSLGCKDPLKVQRLTPETVNTEYNGDTSAELPITEEDIVRYSLEKERVQDKEPVHNN